MKKEIVERIQDVFKEFPDIKIDEFKFVIDALAELFEEEKQKWAEEIKKIISREKIKMKKGRQNNN